MESLETTTNSVKEETTGILKSRESSPIGTTEKSVRIVEPADCLHEIQVTRVRNRILEKRLLVEELIERQIEKRKKQFKQWDVEEANRRPWKLIWKAVILAIFLFLALSMVQSSVCHAHNPRCGVFWHEALISGVFGCFVSTWNERVIY